MGIKIIAMCCCLLLISCSPSMSVMIPAALHPAGFREIPDMRFYAPIKILREETDLRTQC